MKLVSSFENSKVNMQTGVQLDSLWLQGCDFDGVKLNEIRDTSGSSSELIHLPPCNIAWIRNEDAEPYSSGTVVSLAFSFYMCYRTFLFTTQSTEKSFSVLLMSLTVETTGRESLEESHSSLMDLTSDQFISHRDITLIKEIYPLLM